MNNLAVFYAVGFIAMFSIGPLIQLHKIIKLKRSDELSVAFYHINNVGQILSILFNYELNGNVWWYANNGFGIAVNLLTLYFIHKYKHVDHQ
jgi:uncharacterized protein with PQ loop repeat